MIVNIDVSGRVPVIFSVEKLAVDVSGSVITNSTTVLLIGAVTSISIFPGGEMTGSSFTSVTVMNTEALLEMIGSVPSKDAVMISVNSVTEDSASSVDLVVIFPVVSSIAKYSISFPDVMVYRIV